MAGVPCFAESLVQGGSSVLRIKFSTKTPRHRKHPNRNKDGVIKGDDITFTIFVMETNLLVKGKVIGETIKLTFTMDGNEMSFDLAKVAQ